MRPTASSSRASSSVPSGRRRPALVEHVDLVALVHEHGVGPGADRHRRRDVEAVASVHRAHPDGVGDGHALEALVAEALVDRRARGSPAGRPRSAGRRRGSTITASAPSSIRTPKGTRSAASSSARVESSTASPRCGSPDPPWPGKCFTVTACAGRAQPVGEGAGQLADLRGVGAEAAVADDALARRRRRGRPPARTPSRRRSSSPARPAPSRTPRSPRARAGPSVRAERIGWSSAPIAVTRPPSSSIGHQQVLAQPRPQARRRARSACSSSTMFSSRSITPPTPAAARRSTSGSVASVTPGRPTTSTSPARSSSDARLHTAIWSRVGGQGGVGRRPAASSAGSSTTKPPTPTSSAQRRAAGSGQRRPRRARRAARQVLRHVGPQLTHHPQGWHPSGGVPRLLGGEAPPVDLLHRGERDGVDEPDRLRQLVPGQLRLEERRARRRAWAARRRSTGTTTATPISPITSSGRGTIATSATSGWSASTASTSAGYTL